MEALTRLVSESLARYGLDRPVDYRRLQWSRWFRCESLHSLLFVPSKPGVFAIAEEIVDNTNREEHDREGHDWEGHDFSRAARSPNTASALAAQATPVRGKRMLAVLQFGEDDDMAFVLDRMLSRENPMRARLLSGRCFLRYVVIEEESQRRSICNALNQWLVSSGEKVSGIGAHFASSLELSVARTPSSAPTEDPVESEQISPGLKSDPEPPESAQAPLLLDSGAANLRCPQPFPSGF